MNVSPVTGGLLGQGIVSGGFVQLTIVAFTTYVDPRAAYLAYVSPDPRDAYVLNPTPEGNIFGVDPRAATIVK